MYRIPLLKKSLIACYLALASGSNFQVISCNTNTGGQHVMGVHGDRVWGDCIPDRAKH